MTAPLTWKAFAKAVNAELAEKGYKHKATPVIVAQVMLTGLEIAREEFNEEAYHAADLASNPDKDPREAGSFSKPLLRPGP